MIQLYRQYAGQNEREELILGHLGMVRHFVGKLLAHLPAGVDVEGLESAGLIGLVEAANKFDPSRGIKFQTFAYARIRGAIFDELRRNCPLSQHLVHQMAQVRKTLEELNTPDVTVEALAEATGLTPDAVSDCLMAMKLLRQVALDSRSDLADGLAGDPNSQPDVQAEQAEREQLLAQAIQQLSERKRQIVTLYYLKDMRLREISEVFGISESRVSRLLNDALFQMRKYIQARER